MAQLRVAIILAFYWESSPAARRAYSSRREFARAWLAMWPNGHPAHTVMPSAADAPQRDVS